MKVIVFGATGYIGLPIGEALLVVHMVSILTLYCSKCFYPQWSCRCGRNSQRVQEDIAPRERKYGSSFSHRDETPSLTHCPLYSNPSDWGHF